LNVLHRKECNMCSDVLFYQQQMKSEISSNGMHVFFSSVFCITFIYLHLS